MTELRLAALVATLSCAGGVGIADAQENSEPSYTHRLTPLKDRPPLLADHPEYVEPIKSGARFEAPVLVDDADADLLVRAWRFSYNARGIIEVPNRLRGARTAVIVVHPWGVDDGQGWRTPEPAGAAFFCTPEKNRLGFRHMHEVVNPFLKSLRDKVGLVAYSLPGKEDPIRKKLYRSMRGEPSTADRKRGAQELAAKLKDFPYKGQPLPHKLRLSPERPAADYIRKLPTLDAGPVYNGAGFWDLPIPVSAAIEVAARDLVIYDGDGYGPLKEFLQKQGIRHVLLAGYNTDKCVCSTTAGYRNLCKDFNVFLVGDCTLATYPASDTPRFATNAAVALASLEVFITQVSWIQSIDRKSTRP